MDQGFQIGEVYQNRKGVYEVVDLDAARDRLIVRFIDSGEEMETSLSLQERIWQNMSWEEQEAARRHEKEEARYHQKYGAKFTGLTAEDFKTSTEGTSWRSREGLAGKVAVLLSPDSGYTFVSWAIYGWQVAFLTHRENYKMAAFELGSRKTKFVLEVDEDYVYYGLLVEKNNGDMDQAWDWTRLVPRIRESAELKNLISDVEQNSGIQFLGRTSGGDERFHFSDGPERGAISLWPEENPSALTVEERLEELSTMPTNQWGEAYFMSMLPKDSAIEAGKHLGQQIEQSLRALMPLYQAAVEI